mmetsp:Transcript_88167/g.234434  ORF Transcript_88167/g.234434 Transcript_88167/m.234434 type:complete len:237 (-) Transcript_88167:306-1016(-)
MNVPSQGADVDQENATKEREGLPSPAERPLESHSGAQSVTTSSQCLPSTCDIRQLIVLSEDFRPLPGIECVRNSPNQQQASSPHARDASAPTQASTRPGRMLIRAENVIIKPRVPCSSTGSNVVRRRQIVRSDSDNSGFASAGGFPEGSRSLYRRHTSTLIDCLDGLLKVPSRLGMAYYKSDSGREGPDVPSLSMKVKVKGSDKQNAKDSSKSRPRNIVLKQVVDLIWKIQCDEQV